VDRAVRTAGVEHVGLGLDQIQYPPPKDPSPVRAGLERPRDPFVAPPRAYPQGMAYYSYTEGLENLHQVPNVTEGLLRRGYSPANIRQIMGENWLRVYQEVWGQ